jgi:hypothetical protein
VGVDTVNLTPKDWTEFQHYKDRSPIWIKLHRKLLDNFDFHRLPVASRALAPMLWLLASEYDGGTITCTLEELAFRLRMTPGEVAEALNPLLEAKFFVSDSNPLAKRKRNASPEKRRDRERDREEGEKIGADAPRASRLPEDWNPSEDDLAFARSLEIDATREAERFRDYWNARAGPGAVKRDWPATWRNWIRKATESGVRNDKPNLVDAAKKLANTFADRPRSGLEEGGNPVRLLPQSGRGGP